NQDPLPPPPSFHCHHYLIPLSRLFLLRLSCLFAFLLLFLRSVFFLPSSSHGTWSQLHAAASLSCVSAARPSQPRPGPGSRRAHADAGAGTGTEARASVGVAVCAQTASTRP